MIMMQSVLGFFASLLFCVFFMMLLKKAAPALKLIDKPDARKNHEGEIPAIGGLAMFFSVALSCLYPGRFFREFEVMLICMGLLAGCGVLDDRWNLGSRRRLLVQIMTAMIMIGYGKVFLSQLGNLWGQGNIVPDPAFSWLFTVFCAVGVINAINMMDGVDGLAGTLALFYFLVFSFVALFTSRPALLHFCLLMAASLVGFLGFNLRTPWRKKASVFMGNAGSMMLGLSLAWLAIDLTQPDVSHPASLVMTPVTSVWILAVPLMDTVFLMAKRVRAGQSPFKADRDHLHHQLLNAGLSPERVVLVILSLSLIAAGIGISGWMLGIPDDLMLALFLCCFALYGYVRVGMEARPDRELEL